MQQPPTVHAVNFKRSQRQTQFEQRGLFPLQYLPWLMFLAELHHDSCLWLESNTIKIFGLLGLRDCVWSCHSGRGRLSRDERRSHKESPGSFPAGVFHLRLHWCQSQRLPPQTGRSTAGAASAVTGTHGHTLEFFMLTFDICYICVLSYDQSS